MMERQVRCQCHQLLCRDLEGSVEIKCPSCNLVHKIDTIAGTHLTERRPRGILKQTIERAAV